MKSTRWIVVVWLVVFGSAVQAAPRAETILPATTKAMLSTDAIQAVQSAWNATSLGQMFAGPELKPFMDELQQRNAAADAARVPPLGLWLEDVLALSAGSATLAVVPDARQQAAFVLLIDVTDRADAVLKVRQRLVEDFARRKAKTGSLQVGETKVTIYQYPADDKPDAALVTRYYFEQDGLLVVTEREFVVRDLLSRWAGNAQETLASLPAYRETTVALSADASQESASVRFYIDPFGLHAIRPKPVAAKTAGGAKVTSKPAPKLAAKPDSLDQMAEQGFLVIQAIGGVATVGTADLELVFQTRIYAPGELQGAAQLLTLKPAESLAPPEWFPASTASVTSVNWNLPVAFAGYGAWFDATDGMGDVGTFDAILNDIKLDKNSPKVDIRKDVIGILTGPVHAATWVDLVAPGPADGDKPRSHWLYAVKTTNETLLASSLRKMMEGDGDILKPVRKIGSAEVWVYRPDSGETWLGPNLSNVAIAAAKGHWVVASDFATLEAVLSPETVAAPLSDEATWQALLAAVKPLHTEPAAARQFRRLNLSLTETYALLQAGRIQEDSSLLGLALTAWLDGLVPRRSLVAQPAATTIGSAKPTAMPHDLDFRKLPPFTALKKYLGTFVSETELIEHGWQQAGLVAPPTSR